MLRPGDTIAERYEIVAEIGRGGMGIVYEGKRHDLGLPVAVKVLHDPAPKRASRFAHEARITAALRSEHVVRVLDYGTATDGCPFLVMELLEGSSLADELIREKTLSVEAAADWVVEAAAGLAEAHDKRIVHRDLKPSNLFLADGADGTRSLKLLDFGVARALLPEQVRATETCAVMGTPPYMSPEQLRDSRQADARSDIWSLGVILHELLAGNLPFPGETPTAVVAAIAADEPAALPDAIPTELRAVIDRCLRKDASERYQTVMAMAVALAPFGTERGQRALNRVRHLAQGGARRAGTSSVDAAPTVATADVATAGAAPSTLGAVSQALPGQTRAWPKAALAALAALGFVGWLVLDRPFATNAQPGTPAQTSPPSVDTDTLSRTEASSHPTAFDSEPEAGSPVDGGNPSAKPRPAAASAPAPPTRALRPAPKRSERAQSSPPTSSTPSPPEASAPMPALPTAPQPVDPLLYRK